MLRSFFSYKRSLTKKKLYVSIVFWLPKLLCGGGLQVANVCPALREYRGLMLYCHIYSPKLSITNNPKSAMCWCIFVLVGLYCCVWMCYRGLHQESTSEEATQGDIKFFIDATHSLLICVPVLFQGSPRSKKTNLHRPSLAPIRGSSDHAESHKTDNVNMVCV